MNDEIVTIYRIVDDILKAMNFKDDPKAKMSSSEVLTTAIIACLFFGGNFRKALKLMSLFCSYVLSESRFLRRLKRLNQKLENIFEVTVMLFKSILPETVESYAIDTFPIEVCENIRANRCKVASGKEFRGYVASKRVYYHGVKLHIVASDKGYIREFLITPGSVAFTMYGDCMNFHSIWVLTVFFMLIEAIPITRQRICLRSLKEFR